ncbi:MAG TPA: GyrI-like domain-containing protein [Bacteroidales bacterium]|nr:GyrI-like domain-containing protein [Bacteroidales bacterium]
MKVLKWILIAVLSLIVLVVVVGLVLPKEFKASSGTEINLPASHAFYAVATFSDRQSWDPWIELDPESEVSITTEPGYIGSTYSWNGETIGSGRMEVDTTVFGKLIISSIWFSRSAKPAKIMWTFNEKDGITKVTWTMEIVTANPFMKVMNAFMKKSLIESLDKGLANLKKHLETNGVRMSSLSEPVIKVYSGFTGMVAEEVGSINDISNILGNLYGAVMMVVSTQELQPAGVPFALYSDYDDANSTVRVIAGIPVSEPGIAEGMVKPMTFKGFKAVTGTHSGPYVEFNYSYDILMSFLFENGYESTGDSWEFYYSDPQTEPDLAQWKTEIAFVIK